MVLQLILFLGITLISGFVFQSLLHGSTRLLVYPLSFALGILSGYDFLGFRYYLLSFNLGMVSRAAIGGHWHCFIAEIGCMIAGFALVFVVGVI